MLLPGVVARYAATMLLAMTPVILYKSFKTLGVFAGTYSSYWRVLVLQFQLPSMPTCLADVSGLFGRQFRQPIRELRRRRDLLLLPGKHSMRFGHHHICAVAD